MGTVALHALHAAIVIIGTIVVLVLVRPVPHADARRVAELRRAAADGTLADVARERVLAARARAEQPRAGAALQAAALLTMFAAAVHAAVCPEHFREGLRFGLFFLAVSVDQVVLAVMLVRRPSLRVARWAIAINLGTAALWAVTRTVGLPFGLAETEPVRWPDLSSSGTEVVAAALAGYWVWQYARSRRVVRHRSAVRTTAAA